MDSMEYSFEVRPLSEEDGGGYIVTFPDLPGCIADGDTIEEAVKNALDAAQSWLETAREFGDPIPIPGESDDGRVITRVPRSLQARLMARAREEGVSVNTLVTAYLAEGLGRHEARH